MNHKVLLLNAGYSLHSLMKANPNIAAQFGLLGITFGNEVMVTDRTQLIAQISQSVKDSQLTLLLDNAPQLRAREILAQGFHKPLYQDPQITQNISSYLQKSKQTNEQDLLKNAMIPQDAIALSEPGCAHAGFVLFFPTTCVALIPGPASAALRLVANQLFPLLLRQFHPGAVTVDIPIRDDKTTDVLCYIERVRRRSKGFLPLLGGTETAPVLRLIAIKENENLSRQCCDSFLEDMVSECGNVTTIARVGIRGLRAVEKKCGKTTLPPPEFTAADLSAGPAPTADVYSRGASSSPYPPVREDTPSPPDNLSASYLIDPDDPLDYDDYGEDPFDDEDDCEEQDDLAPKPPAVSRRQKRSEKKKARRAKQRASRDEDDAPRRRSPLISCLLLVFVCVFLGSVGYLGHYYWKSAQNRTAYESLREVYDSPGLLAPLGYPLGYDKDFSGLWEINPDVVGWISIDGTALDYPVVQTTDNVKYYRTNFEGQYSEHAVPFVDTAVNLKKPSDNVIIYGHNIRTDGQMFNILKGYKDLEYFQQHPVIDFDSVYQKGQYKIISVFYTNTRSEHGEIFSYHDFIDAQSTQEKQDYIDNVLIRSIINTGVDVNASDELLTLSTCTYEFKDARYVVVARKVRRGEDAAVNTAQAAMNPTPLYPDVWYQLFGGSKPDANQLKANLPH